MPKKKKASSDVVFDDDTSDSDDELESFRKNMKKVSKADDNDDDDDDDDDDDELDSNDVEEEEDSDEDDSSSGESDDGDDIPAKDDSQIKSKLGKLGSLLGTVSDNEDDDDDDDDDDEEDDENESDIEQDEDSAEEVIEPGDSDNEDDNLENSEHSDNESDDEDSKVKQNQNDRKNSKRKNEEHQSPTKKPRLLSEEEERARYRNTLSKLSVEEILKIKESLGTKAFDNKWSGKQKNKEKKAIPVFKRENKNRPREISSKVRVPKFIKVVPVPKDVKRDPRFDPLCGEFDKKVFRRSYKFLNEIKEKELKVLKSNLKGSHGEDRDKLKYLIQRTENQLRAEKQTAEKEKAEMAERRERKEMLMRGEQPFFKSKKTKREEEMVRTYEKLKETGAVDSYIKKKGKKNSSKDKRMLGKT